LLLRTARAGGIRAAKKRRIDQDGIDQRSAIRGAVRLTETDRAAPERAEPAYSGARAQPSYDVRLSKLVERGGNKQKDGNDEEYHPATGPQVRSHG
jgi:hypothetical protein